MNKEELKFILNSRGISASDEQVNELFLLMENTLKTNEKFNLTAIKDEDNFIDKMLIDSAFASKDYDLSNKKCLDVGTGAGFPGLVLYVLNKDINLTLLDSTKKKIDYLKEYTFANGYDVKCISDRCENYAKEHREEYDFVFARAVAPLNVLIEIILPLVKVGGLFVALKGPDYINEMEEAKNAFKKLNCHVEKIYSDYLPISNSERDIIYIKKEKVTNKKYPRDYKDILSKPI